MRDGDDDEPEPSRAKQEFPSMAKHAKVFEDKAKSAIQQAEELEK